jgi:hypothetical protein
MNKFETLQSEIKAILRHAYPEILVRVEPFSGDPSRPAIYFEEEKFTELYPWQRYHYLIHLIPVEYFKAHLTDSVWFELAPGETAADLVYPDEELIKSITPDVMKCINASGFLKALDDVFCPRLPFKAKARCHGDFRISKELLPKHGFTVDEFFDIFHVLMAQGGFCDCEIIFNVAEESRLKSAYWKARAKGLQPPSPHD